MSWPFEMGSNPTVEYEVVSEHCGMVTVKTRVGGTRIVDAPSREELPRIC
jgi:hydrogenase expression/formation protein HypE